jgi:hypothetical protein
MELNPLLALKVSTRAQANAFAPEFDVSTRSVRSASDALAWTLTITRELAAALESSERVIGIVIEIDKGDGVLVPLLQTEIDGTVNLKASRDGYGSRTLSFTVKVPPSESPFYTAWSRAPHRVKMTGFLGLPGTMQPRPMFIGHVAQCSWEAYPSLLRIDCQDLSALLSSEMLAYNLEPGSLRTRKSVFREIFEPYLTLHGIEFGSLDFGSNDGGLLYKGISEGGTVSLLQWAAAFLAPIARRLNFGDGSCNVEPSYVSSPVVRTYRANDIANLTVSLPGTSDPNAVVMSGTVFAYIGPSGHRTEIEIKVTRGVFAPASALRRQDHGTGVISDLAGEIAAVDQEVSRTITTRIYNAGTIVGTSEQEWGWYSARACLNEQLADGSITWNHAFDVYQYADGSWRMEAQQQYQLLRQTVTEKRFSAGNPAVVNEELTTVHQFSACIVPLGFIDEAGVEMRFPAFLTADGIGWFAGCEFFEDERAPEGFGTLTVAIDATALAANGRRLASNHGYCATLHRLDYGFTESSEADGASISKTTTLTQSYGAFSIPYGPPPIGASAYIFGPVSTPRYGPMTTAFNYVGLDPQVITIFAPIDETSHRETVVVRDFEQWIDVDASRIVAIPVAGERIVAGAIPKIQRATAGQAAQPASVTVVDAVREALLGKEVDDHQQNDFCETLDELKVCALELLREKAPAVEFDALIDWTAAPGKAIALLLPDAIPAGEVLTAWDLEWVLNGMTGENKQHVIARWLPQELR